MVHMKTMEKAEENLLYDLGNNENPLGELSSIKNAASIKRVYDEANDRYSCQCINFVSQAVYGE